MKSATIKKAMQDDNKRSQTTIKNINYIQKLMSIF